MMSTSRLHTITLGAWLTLVTLLVCQPVMAAENKCKECHKDPIFRMHNHKLYTYYQDWLTSPHQAAGITCDQCHGGDPASSDMEIAHKGVGSSGNPKSRVFFKNQPDTCGQCHTEVAEQFTKSKHYKSLMIYAAAPNCSTCHRAMNRKPYYHDIVDATCRTCHNKQMLHDVAEQAEEILRRLNITKGYLGWASLYYSVKKWPGTTKQDLRKINDEYHNILAKGHAFDLTDSDSKSADLLTRLKLIFDEAWEICHQRKECEEILK